jgi:hypothetical protein
MHSNDLGSTNWLDAPKQQTQDHEEFNTVVAGEEVAVNVEFRNPLQAKLRVAGVRLVCEFTPATSAAEGSGSGDKAGSTSGGGAGPHSSAALGSAPPSLQQQLLSRRHASSVVRVSSTSGGRLPGSSSMDGSLSGRGSMDGGGGDEEHPLARAGPLRPKNEYLVIEDDRFTLHPGEVRHCGYVF